MEYIVSHPGFQQQILSVHTTSAFKHPILLLDGIKQNKSNRQYLLKNDTGEDVIIQLKRFLDPVPAVTIDGLKVKIAPRLTWYEYFLIVFPFLLVISAIGGGVIGGAIGGVGVILNGSIIRSPRPRFIRYGLTILTTLGCFFAYIAFHFLLLIGLGLS